MEPKPGVTVESRDIERASKVGRLLSANDGRAISETTLAALNFNVADRALAPEDTSAIEHIPPPQVRD